MIFMTVPSFFDLDTPLICPGFLPKTLNGFTWIYCESRVLQLRKSEFRVLMRILENVRGNVTSYTEIIKELCQALPALVIKC